MLFRSMNAKLNGEIASQSGVRSYVRAALTNKGGLVAHVLPNQEELISYAEASALIVVNEDLTSLRNGSDVEVLLLDRGGN